MKATGETGGSRAPIYHGIALTSCVTTEDIYLVWTIGDSSPWLADAFDGQGLWLERFRLGSREELDLLIAGISGEGAPSSYPLRRSTRILRSLWRDDDQSGSSTRDYEVEFDEFEAEAFEHESFLVSGGKEGKRANWATTAAPRTRFCLPVEQWATSDSTGLVLRGANFAGASVKGADLRHCDLRGADFSNCDLRNANLFGLDLKGCKFASADLSSADLRETRNLSLDNSRIDETQFSPGYLWLGRNVRYVYGLLRKTKCRAWLPSVRYENGPVPLQDQWSALRRKYTGPMMFFHLILCLVYFLPMALRTFAWSEFNRLQVMIASAQSSMSSPLVSPCMAPTCGDPIPVGLAVLGYPGAASSLLMACLLLSYNLVRGSLTYRVSLLRDEEERSHRSPARTSYSWLYVLHTVNTWIFVPVAFHLAERAWKLLAQTSVVLPAS